MKKEHRRPGRLKWVPALIVVGIIMHFVRRIFFSAFLDIIPFSWQVSRFISGIVFFMLRCSAVFVIAALILLAARKISKRRKRNGR